MASGTGPVRLCVRAPGHIAISLYSQGDSYSTKKYAQPEYMVPLQGKLDPGEGRKVGHSNNSANDEEHRELVLPLVIGAVAKAHQLTTTG